MYTLFKYVIAKFILSSKCVFGAVDEGHRVKNMRSKLGTLLKRQTTDFRLLLTVCHVVLTL